MTTSAKQGTASRAVKLRRWAVVLSILALSALGGILAWRWVQDGERQQALRLAERGDFSNAEPLLKRVAERHPRDTQVARALALGYLSSAISTALAHRLKYHEDMMNHTEKIENSIESAQDC